MATKKFPGEWNCPDKLFKTSSTAHLRFEDFFVNKFYLNKNIRHSPRATREGEINGML